MQTRRRNVVASTIPINGFDGKIIYVENQKVQNATVCEVKECELRVL